MKKENHPLKFPLTKQIFIGASVALALILYFFYYTLFGHKGIIEYFQLRQQLKEKEIIQKTLENKKKTKQDMVDGMSLDSLDLDLLDEEARKNLGYADEDEIVIYED